MLPLKSARHVPLGKRRLGRIGRIMVFPPAAGIFNVDIIEDHCAKAKQYDLSYTADIQGRMEPVFFEILPADAIVVAERRNVFSKNVPQEPKLKTFVHRVCCNDEFLVTLKQDHLSALGMSPQRYQGEN